MTHQAPPSPTPSGTDPGRQVAQLREALRLVERIAGREVADGDGDLDDAARISSAYDSALPVVQHRFDGLAAETGAWVSAGVEALLAAGRDDPPRAAAARLADELEDALKQMAALLRR